jgi:hypothetical protein
MAIFQNFYTKADLRKERLKIQEMPFLACLRKCFANPKLPEA